MKHFLNLLLLLGFTALFGGDANGQLLYTTLNNSNQPVIRQTNLDGSGNTVFNIGGLAEASESQYSNDGRLIAVTGKTFAQTQQNQISTNVFVFDPLTNQTRQVTNFTDFTSGSGVNSQLLTTKAVFKSFSPDGSVLAVSSRTLLTPSQAGHGRALTFFRVSDGQQLGQPLIDLHFNGTSTGGEGVSWSPVADLIAIPTTTPNPPFPTLSAPSPISGFNSAGQPLGNLTFPMSGSLNGQPTLQHDMYPSFSPNGIALAYFRSTRIGFGATPSLLDLRISSPAGDRSILPFTPGLLPLGLSWSPDGTQLSFSVGNQPVFLGALLGYMAEDTSASISIVNVDGSSPTPFLSAPAGFPDYFPGNVSSGVGDVNMDGVVSFLDIAPFIAVLSTPGAFQAEADIDLNGQVNFLDIAPFIVILAGQ